MSIDQSLSETVFVLQRQDLAPETREIVDEAARLLNEGREGEAQALIEKAEALITIRQAGCPKSVNRTSTAQARALPTVQELVAPLAARLTDGLTQVLTSVLEDLHRFAGDQVQVVAESLQGHIDHMDATLHRVAGAGERLDQLSAQQQAGIQALEQGHRELGGAVRALQQSGCEQNDSIAHVARTTEDLSNHCLQNMEAVGSRIAGLEQRVSLLDRVSQEFPAQLEPLVARIDRHTESLRRLEQRHSQRVSTLNQVLDSLARLKEPEPSEMAAVA